MFKRRRLGAGVRRFAHIHGITGAAYVFKGGNGLAAVKPVLEWLPGWKEDISAVACYDKLPENAKKYLARIAELVDSELAIISVGPRRDQTFEV